MSSEHATFYAQTTIEAAKSVLQYANVAVSQNACSIKREGLSSTRHGTIRDFSEELKNNGSRGIDNGSNLELGNVICWSQDDMVAAKSVNCARSRV